MAARAASRPGATGVAIAALAAAFAGREPLDVIFELEPAVRWRATPGRETFPWDLDSPRGRVRVVVKRLRGGEAGDFWRERLLGGQWRSAARREFDALAALGRHAGEDFALPAALWHGEEALARAAFGRRFGRSALVLEHVPHACTLRQALERGFEAAWRRHGAAVVALVARLHALGWVHRDLYLEHVVIRTRDARLVLLDLGRALEARSSPLRSPRGWFAKDLAAVLHSVPAIDARDLVERYLGARRLADDPATWLAAVEARRARLARHAPRHLHDVAGVQDVHGEAPA